jgi:hypothetical protein
MAVGDAGLGTMVAFPGLEVLSLHRMGAHVAEVARDGTFVPDIVHGLLMDLIRAR